MIQKDQFSIKIRKTNAVQKGKKIQQTNFAYYTFIADEAIRMINIIIILDMSNYEHHNISSI